MKVTDAEWSGKDDCWVKNTHPFGFEINDKIKEKKNVAYGLIKRFYSAGKTITFPAIFRELKKSGNSNCFNTFFAEYIKKPSDGVELGTLKKYNACLAHLNDFNPKIAFQDLTADLIDDFHIYLKKTVKLKGSTMDSYFDAFKKVVNLARKAHYYKDLIKLKKEYLVHDHEVGYMILGERDKNDEQNIIPLFKFPEAAKIIKKYSSTDPKDPFVFRRDVFIEEPVYNRQLKDIAPKARITKSISNKVARHSNVQLYIRLGTHKPVLSKMAPVGAG